MRDSTSRSMLNVFSVLCYIGLLFTPTASAGWIFYLGHSIPNKYQSMYTWLQPLPHPSPVPQWYTLNKVPMWEFSSLLTKSIECGLRLQEIASSVPRRVKSMTYKNDTCSHLFWVAVNLCSKSAYDSDHPPLLQYTHSHIHTYTFVNTWWWGVYITI